MSLAREFICTGTRREAVLSQAAMAELYCAHPLQWTSHSGCHPSCTTGWRVVPARSALAAALRGRDGPTNMLLLPLPPGPVSWPDTGDSRMPARGLDTKATLAAAAAPRLSFGVGCTGEKAPLPPPVRSPCTARMMI